MNVSIPVNEWNREPEDGSPVATELDGIYDNFRAVPISQRVEHARRRVSIIDEEIKPLNNEGEISVQDLKKLVLLVNLKLNMVIQLIHDHEED